MALLRTLLAITIFLGGCSSFQPPVPAEPVCPPCPSEDVVIITECGPLTLKKGFVCPENYFTMEEWNKLIMEYYNSLLPRQKM